ncbi:glycosyltransferase family 39 protein [Aquipuribacter nitratireducens]|uniref:Glycosyltransferase family 39 protein n=1 Tax=Aquipuribacter nitratireducens TaxID=650104 RepID=A0ABW0GME5_9MICO
MTLTARDSLPGSASQAEGQSPLRRHRLSGWAAGAVPVLLVAALLALAGRYGYHRDELYFRLLAQRPAWGYVDQPPFTPLVARAATALLGDSVWAMRVPAALAAGGLAVLLALLARELGGSGRAQVVAALGAVSASPLISGHVLLTASTDWPLWVLVALLVARAQLRRRPGWWVVAGAVAGVALANKLLVVLLLASLAAGLLLAGPRGTLATRWPWLGALTALAVGSPTVAYQLLAGLPQLDMAGSLTGGSARWLVVPGQLLVLGPPGALVWGAGLVALCRLPRWRPVRALAPAYVLALALLLAVGGQFYYTTGFLLVLWGAGAVVLADDPLPRLLPWLRGRRLTRLLTVNVATSAVVALPLLPVPLLAGSGVPALNPAVGDQVGWPRYAQQVADVVDTLPPEQRAHAVVLTENYGEAGALDRYGPALDLPPVYSGHNALHAAGPPPAAARTAVVLVQDPDRAGGGDAVLLDVLDRTFRRCEPVGRLDSGTGVPNEEQGTAVVVCDGLRRSWTEAWRDFRYVGLSTFCHPCRRLGG